MVWIEKLYAATLANQNKIAANMGRLAYRPRETDTIAVGSEGDKANGASSSLATSVTWSTRALEHT